MKELIVAHGGKAGSSVSAKTAFLLAGSKPGPEKLRKCEKLGIPVIDEAAFRAMLPDADSPASAGLSPDGESTSPRFSTPQIPGFAGAPHSAAETPSGDKPADADQPNSRQTVEELTLF